MRKYVFGNIITNIIKLSASNPSATDNNVNTTTPLPTAKEEEKDVDPTNPSVEKKEEGVENSSQRLITSSHDGRGEGGGGIDRSTTDLWPENPIRHSVQVNREEEKSQGSVRGQEAEETGLESLLGSWAAFAQPLLLEAKVDNI